MFYFVKEIPHGRRQEGFERRGQTRLQVILPFLLLSLFWPCLLFGKEVKGVDPTHGALQTLKLELKDGVELNFLLHGDALLGLMEARVKGHSLTSANTLQFPLLAEEFNPNRRVAPFLRLEKVVEESGGFDIHTTVLGSHEKDLFRTCYVFAGDRKKAKTHLLSPR